MSLEDKINELIRMNNELFLQHRYGRIDPVFGARTRALADEIAQVDTDGSIARRLAKAASDFFAEEMRLHPPGTVDPYADIAPEPAEGDVPMTRERLLALHDTDPETLVNDVGMALFEKLEEGVELTGPEVPVYVLWLWNNEIQNGGLCQFFVNDGEYAAFVPAALNAVGAKEYAVLLQDFIAQHDIDLDDLSQFDLDVGSEDDDMSAYTDATELYPFDEFDDAYYALYETAPLDVPVAAYIRDHAEAFITP